MSYSYTHVTQHKTNKGYEVLQLEQRKMSILTGKSYSDEQFNPKEYLNFLYPSSLAFKDVFDFYRQQLYNFYTKYSCKWDNKTARLLEFVDQ